MTTAATIAPEDVAWLRAITDTRPGWARPLTDMLVDAAPGCLVPGSLGLAARWARIFILAPADTWCDVVDHLTAEQQAVIDGVLRLACEAMGVGIGMIPATIKELLEQETRNGVGHHLVSECVTTGEKIRKV